MEGKINLIPRQPSPFFPIKQRQSNFETNRRELGFAHLLEFALSLETILPVWGPSDPSNVMIRIEIDPFLPKMLILIFVKLQSIIVDQDIGRAALELVCTDGLFDRFYCWGNNPGKTLLINRALDGDMGERSGADTRGRLRGIILGIVGQLRYRADTLSGTPYDDLTEELRVAD